jgi:predicted acetyltransferase
MLRLEEANIKYIDELEKFYKEIIEKYANDKNQFAGCFGITKMKLDEWISLCNIRKDDNFKSYVPSTTYFCLNDKDELVGIIDLRHHINHPILSTVGGHCGYSVRPSFRGHGYAKVMLKLLLECAFKRNIKKILITCDDTNIASKKTILACGGVLENQIDDNGVLCDRFWINK